jgi:hypothetical protein
MSTVHPIYKLMKSSYYFIAAIIFILAPEGCNMDLKEIRINGKGPVITTSLDLASFDKIEHTGVANYYITIGSTQSVILKAQQNIIDIMTWEVRDHALKVGLQEHIGIETHDEIRFDITVPSINNIDLTGVGDFFLTGPDQNELTITLTGVGNIDAFELRTDTCNITFSGVGNCKLFVTDLLSGTLSGVGNVYYKGNPEINLNVTGAGRLIDSN